MPIGSSKVGVMGAGLVPGGTQTFNASGTFSVPPGVRKVNITGKGAPGNPGNSGTTGNVGSDGGGGGGGSASGGANPTYINNQSRPGGAGGGGAAGGSVCLVPNGCPFPSTAAKNGNSGTGGSTGASGNAGSAGNAGTAGNSSSTLCKTFPGGAGGNAGAAGNAGTGGSGGPAGGGGSFTPFSINAPCYGPPSANTPPFSVVLSVSGGGAGTGGGPGGTGRMYKAFSPGGCRVRWPSSGGGGAGVTNDGSTGISGNPCAPDWNSPLPSLSYSRPSQCYPNSPIYFNSVFSAVGAAGGNPGGGAGGGGGSWNTCPCNNIPNFGAQAGGAATATRAGGGGGGPRMRPSVLGAGGGGGGRGGAGNAGGSGGSGGAGAAANPNTFNCVTVTPGGSVPVTVASPGGQIVISWNPQ